MYGAITIQYNRKIMIKCLECGKESMRLQWTHFKYNCTGRFNNGSEYLKIYPNARIVDESIAKKTAVTKENMILKYGEIEGLIRWDSYRNKQAISNSLEYKKKKYGWTNEHFEEYNKSRAITLSNFISKYGESTGLIKWNDYCERQRYTTTKEYFIDKYGETEGTIKWDNFCDGRLKSFNLDYIEETYQVSQQEAENILSQRLVGNYVSEGEKTFVNCVFSILPDITHTYQNKQYCIWNRYTKSPMFYDITSTAQMKIIEYNGDYWHANPCKYNESFIIKQSGKTAKEIWERDSLKLLSAKDRGFDTFIVWESEFQNSPTEIMKKIQKWWNNEL